MQLSRFPTARMESEMFGVLDICNHRLDAWFTSLAARRLATLRAATPAGVVIGGWGCLQDVRRADPLDPQQRAEFVHTPSLDQAAAVAVLRSGARRAQRAGSNHADIDLSSRRVRLARWILEGVRNGRSLGELLGVRFERAVKGTPAAAQLGDLRALFPGSGRMSVLDGLVLQKAGLPASSSTDVVRAATVMDDALDAVADALTAEAVYQIVKGNPVGALVNVEAIAAGAAPPELHVTETPASGISPHPPHRCRATRERRRARLGEQRHSPVTCRAAARCVVRTVAGPFRQHRAHGRGRRRSNGLRAVVVARDRGDRRRPWGTEQGRGTG